MSEMMISTIFAMVFIMRITGVEISKIQNVQNKLHFRKISNHSKSYIHCLRTMRIMRMMRITEIEISKKSKCAEQTAVSKSLKSL